MKSSLGATAVILAMSLAAWVFFYLATGPLTAPETTVVVGICAVIVVFAKWLWTRMRKPVKENRT